MWAMSLEQNLQNHPINTTSINIQNVQVKGEIPDSISRFTSLQQLYLNNNQITEIPDSISCLTNLRYLQLSNNQITGEIPDSISCLTNLQQLHLNNNQIIGEIPESISNLSQLQSLYLNDNQLLGEIPESISNLSNLQTLYAYNNHLYGEIPESISCLQRLRQLNLQNNYFSKNIPKNLMSHHLISNQIRNGNMFQDIPDSLKAQVLKYKQRIWDSIKKQYHWNDEEINTIVAIDKILSTKDKLPKDFNELAQTNEYIKLHENDIYSWKGILNYLKTKQKDTNHFISGQKSELDLIKKQEQELTEKENQLEEQLTKIKREKQLLLTRKQTIENEIKHVIAPVDKMNQLVTLTEQITIAADNSNKQVQDILKKSKYLKQTISKNDIRILIDNMNLVQYTDNLITSKVYTTLNNIDSDLLIDIGMKVRDACCFVYNIEMMRYNRYANNIKDGECIICEHNTPLKTIQLLKEYGIELRDDIVIHDNWIAPYFLYLSRFNEFKISNIMQLKIIRKKLQEWKQIHSMHVKNKST